MANLKHKGEQNGRIIKLSGLVSTVVDRVESKEGLLNFLTALLITEGLKPLFTGNKPIFQ